MPKVYVDVDDNTLSPEARAQYAQVRVVGSSTMPEHHAGASFLGEAFANERVWIHYS
jgi:hypothetical protein